MVKTDLQLSKTSDLFFHNRIVVLEVQTGGDSWK